MNGGATTQLARVLEAGGHELSRQLHRTEVRLGEVADSHGPELGRHAASTLAAGGKRLRPMLVLLCAGPEAGDGAISAATAIELVHMATLVHDDLIDGARLRRGRASAWAAHGEDAARAGGDFLFARAFAQLRDSRSQRILADACLALASGEALQRRQLHDPDTTVEAYIERCVLKTGKLFEAACLLGGGDGGFGLALGVAFQIADDILDCSGVTIETGKIAGTDLREGTPTLPLILAARKDAVVRAALAGGSLDGALLRVGATGALERSREVALDYAREARSRLDGAPRARELEALTHLVVNRET